MFSRNHRRVTIAAAVAACALATPLTASATNTATSADTSGTSTISEFLASQNRNAEIMWEPCQDVDANRIPGAGTYDCASIEVPLDYTNPAAGTYSLNVLRHHARKPESKKGVLFVNPGGPGYKASDLALAAPVMFGDKVVDSFDVIGIDPRGVAGSHATYCFASENDRREKLGKAYTSHAPHDAAEEGEMMAGFTAFADHCKHNAAALNYVSTSLTARDMDTVRTRLGEEKINYLGFSYGTVLGQYYANMFPDRIRTMVIDGVVNASSWAGTDSGKTILASRTRQADATDRVIRDLLRRCDEAGPSQCDAAPGAQEKLDELLAAFKSDGTLTLNTGTADDPQVSTFFKHTIVTDIRNDLYRNNNEKAAINSFLWLYKKYAEKMPMPAEALTTRVNSPTSNIDQGLTIELPPAVRKAVNSARSNTSRSHREYNNYLDAQKHTMCNDMRSMPTAADGARQSERVAARGYGTASWSWWDGLCRSDLWPGRAQGSYAGTFTQRTANPILVVGNSGDPATNIESARDVAAAMPGSKLLTTNSWGHTAYPNSECAARKVDAYLLSGSAPAADTCSSERQPFGTR